MRLATRKIRRAAAPGSGALQTYLDLSRQIGGDVATHANLVNAAFHVRCELSCKLSRTRNVRGNESLCNDGRCPRRPPPADARVNER
ncbi:hypothetical protein EVAR_90337_1 [Eumeta japonica]|uniref:Uncharacterized protein n=1 Tax=Eumeta variegata TaxID=151549 RepID=A0A4C1YGG7_EUMVA|nr:hypothetical protein EVAR_90337_1 [Eumeta japonica]